MPGSNPFRRDRPLTQTPTSAPLGREDDNLDTSLRFPPLNIDSRLPGYTPLADNADLW
jgi:hypothetical protein